MVFDNTFVCTGTGKSYYKRDQLHSGTINVIYFTSCSKCLEQYVGSAVKFKTRLNIYKSDIKTKSERCGVIVSVIMILIPCSTLRSSLLAGA